MVMGKEVLRRDGEGNGGRESGVHHSLQQLYSA